MKALTRRVKALEQAQRQGALLVCSCSTANHRVNLPPGEHLPDCPALSAGPRDLVMLVRYAEGGRDATRP